MTYKSKNLNDRKHNANDELYTRYTDIDAEVKNYTEFLRGKIVYCNCSNPAKSNFAKYFVQNFNLLELKGLFVTGFSPDSHGTALKINKIDCSVESDEDYNTFITNNIYELSENGAFDSDESKELLATSDIVIDNPPFSLFRDYIDLLIRTNKKFLCIGPMMACQYKHCVQYIMQAKLSTGINAVKLFTTSDGTQKKFGNICWFTNLPNSAHGNFIELHKKYNPVDYPVYDGTNIINVNRIKDIPEDYTGVMGVPGSFVLAYNPEQFKILGVGRYKVNGKQIFMRTLIQKINAE